MQLLHHAAQRLALADVPEVIATALRLGRMVALRKPNGRVRGLVMGGTFRRLVARTLARQFSLGTRAGTEAAARAVRALCERDPRATVVSIDGVGAYDHVHRASMLGGLAGDNALAPLLPFARLFYAESSTYLWYDDAGMPHSVVQAEGGEQGDPLMPALHALGQHPALQAASATLLPGETVFAYLDDVYAVCPPERVCAVAGVARVVLQEHAGIEVHLGKTRIWNAAGEEPAGTRALQGPGGADARAARPGCFGHPRWPCQLRPGLSATEARRASTAARPHPLRARFADGVGVAAAPLLRAATVQLLAESIAAG